MSDSLMKRLEKVLARHLARSLPPSRHETGQSLNRLLGDYLVWRDRFVAPRPREVKLSKAMRLEMQHGDYQPELETLCSKIRDGEDLGPHLSSAAHSPFRDSPSKPAARRSDRDLLLSDWGVHHLHLSSVVRPNGLMERTEHVLFAMFTDDTAYLIGVFEHPQHANWAAEDIFATIVRSWPGHDLALESRFVVSLKHQFSDEDRLLLRESGVGVFLEVDGKVYLSRTLGQATDGTPGHISRRAQLIIWTFREHQDTIEAHLRGQETPGEWSYWRPAVHIVHYGFEEWAGFMDHRKFVPLVRIV